MPFTNFPGGISSLGMPVLPGGVPIMGPLARVFFVDGARGSNGNKGTDWRKPVATVTKALTLCTDKAGDVIVLMNDGNTSGTSRDTATIAWSLDNTHLVGLCAPTNISQRARISPPNDATAIVTPQLHVTGNGNSFWNFSLFEGDAENGVASIGIHITGSRNYFNNVAVLNMGDAVTGNSGDEAASANILIDGGEENLFENCYIGLDTAIRTAANANVELISAAARNTFRKCQFNAYADATAPLFVKVDGAGDIDRFVLFEKCLFQNSSQSGATSMDAAIVTQASQGGHIIVWECGLVGCDDWTAADNTKVRLIGSSPDGSLKSVGIAQDVDIT